MNLDYKTEGSSNSVTNGEPFTLEIKISPNQKQGKKYILPQATFSVTNLQSIVNEADLKNIICKLSGEIYKEDKNENGSGRVDVFTLAKSDDPNTQYGILPRDYKIKYTYLTLEISGNKCTINKAAILKIIFFEETGLPELKENEIEFKIIPEETKPEINEFSSNFSVINCNENVELNWKIKGEKYILWEGLNVLAEGEVHLNGGYEIEEISLGDHLYTLEVIQGSTSETKKILVRALNSSELYSISISKKEKQLFIICNFCVSQNASNLFSIMIAEKEKKKKEFVIDNIGYTHDITGFSNDWEKLVLSEPERECLKPFATSPMIHLKSDDETLGRLLLIGGSHVKPMETSNAVAIIYLDEEPGKKVIIVKDNIPWNARMGHSCNIFPFGNVDKIWLLGGMDEFGNALNDIWVSGDGYKWENISKDGNVNINKGNIEKMDWAARCLAGATVILNDNGSKNELWIGGGFAEIGGKETSDLWKWNKEGWTQIPDIGINNNESYLSSGISFIGKDTLNSTGLFFLGKSNIGNKETYFHRLIKQNNRYSNEVIPTTADILNTNKESKIISYCFKNCLFFMVLTNEGDLGITYSSLYYWVPVISSYTRIIN